MEAMQIVQGKIFHIYVPYSDGEGWISPPLCGDAVHAAQLPAGVQIELNGLDDLPTVIAGRQKSLTFVILEI